MKSLILIAAILVAHPALAQEIKHAPTKDVCQADQAVWWEQLSDPTIANLALEAKDIATRQLYNWFSEMSDCTIVDKENASAYNRTLLRILVVVGVRYDDFIRRHDLKTQFLKEDDAGER